MQFLIRFVFNELRGFSALQRAEIAEIYLRAIKYAPEEVAVSVLFNEPKLLKYRRLDCPSVLAGGFSALQRAEIAEMFRNRALVGVQLRSFSALQRAEIAEK